MIVDCHTHWQPDWSGPAGAADPTLWLETVRRQGIAHAIVLPSRGLADDTQLVRDNDEVCAVSARSGGLMLPFCTVNPYQGQPALHELDRCIEDKKVRGIKFHPWMQGVSISHPLMDDVCERAEAAGIPLFFHDGTPPMSLPSQAGLLARRHPRATVILGHCGLLEYWQEAILVMQSCPNVWGCLCSPHPAAMREIFARGPQDRLVWGSDFGFGRGEFVSYRLGLLRCAVPRDSDQELLLRINPSRLFGLV